MFGDRQLDRICHQVCELLGLRQAALMLFSHQQKCKNVVQDRVNFDAGALLRGRAIDARRIGLHRPRENSLQWGACIARYRDRRGCTAMHPNSVAPNWDALQGIGMHCDTAPFKLKLKV